MKIPIENEMKYYMYKGRKLTPLTPAEAMSLDGGDKVKFIGSTGHRLYNDFRRQVFTLSKKPKVGPNAKGTLSIGIDY